MRYGFMLLLLLVLAFCLFGFLATFEPNDATKQWTWRIIYGFVGVACVGGLGLAARRGKSR